MAARSRSPLVRRALTAAALALLAGTVLAAFAGPLLLPGLRPLIAWRFPHAPWVSPEALARQPACVLLDARSASEFAVSRIAGARRLEASVLAALPRDATIVVYCSVGYRSAEAVERLRDLGFKDARNLDGGLFAWANAGRPLVNDAGATTLVHPYGLPWSLLLDAARRPR